MKHRSRRATVVLIALAGAAIAVAGWLSASALRSSGGDGNSQGQDAARSASRTAAVTSPQRTSPGLSRAVPGSTSVRTPLGSRLPARPTGTRHRPPASRTFSPALVRMPGIRIGSRCALPNFPARTSNGTAVKCYAGRWHRL